MIDYVLKNKEWIFSGIGILVIGWIVWAIRSVVKKIRSKKLIAEGWQRITYQDKSYAWDGPLESLIDGQPKPTPDGLDTALRENGMEPAYANPKNLLNAHAHGYVQIFEIDLKRKRKHALLAKILQVLLVRPANKRN